LGVVLGHQLPYGFVIQENPRVLGLRRFDRSAVHEDAIPGPGARAEGNNGAVDADPPGGDPLLDLAA
jgi:hypothetical protein